MAGLLTWSPWTRLAHPASWQTELTVEGVRLCLNRRAEARVRDLKDRLDGEAEGQP